MHPAVVINLVCEVRKDGIERVIDLLPVNPPRVGGVVKAIWKSIYRIDKLAKTFGCREKFGLFKGDGTD